MIGLETLAFIFFASSIYYGETILKSAVWSNEPRDVSKSMMRPSSACNTSAPLRLAIPTAPPLKNSVGNFTVATYLQPESSLF